MPSVGFKARLSALEARLISTNDPWWVVKVVQQSGDRNIHFVGCGGEVYTKDANESAEELIQRVRVTSQAEKIRIILASASTLDR
jgi:hypothetical protein